MKQIAAVILILSVFSFQFSELFVLISFKINQDYIAKTLCVEKDVEGSKCNGCCQLKKKVKEQQEQKSKSPLTETEKLIIDFYSNSCNLNVALYSRKIELLVKNRKEYYLIICHSIFHPPKIPILN